MTAAGSHPLPLEELLAYRRGELDADAERALEEHFFSCATCAERLSWVERLEESVAAAMRKGLFDVYVTKETVERLERAGSVVRKYDVGVGQPVSCTIAPDDDLTVVTLRGPLRPGVPVSVQAEFLDHASGQSFAEVRPAFQDPSTGNVIVSLAGTVQKSLGHVRVTLALRFGDGPDEDVVGPFVMNHSPWPGKG
jgi:anti-sigma factor RsiW